MPTVLYRPNAVGTYAECGKGSGGSSKLDCIDDVVHDGAGSCIYGLNHVAFWHETFNFANPTESGLITNVKLTTVCAAPWNTGTGQASKGVIYTPGRSIVYGAHHDLPADWTAFEDNWATNPWTGVAWTWADLNALEIGVALRGNSSATYSGWCTQIFVEITYDRYPYTPGIPSGPGSGSTGASIGFSTSAVDPDGDNVLIVVNWGDSVESNTGWIASSQSATLYHSWANPGTYLVKAYAIDPYGASSGWSGTATIVIRTPGSRAQIIGLTW